MLDGINSHIPKGYKFSHINKTEDKTINDKLYMSYEFYFNQPMQEVEIKLNMVIAKTPNLINSPNRCHNHPLTRKYCHVPFKN